MVIVRSPFTTLSLSTSRKPYSQAITSQIFRVERSSPVSTASSTVLPSVHFARTCGYSTRPLAFLPIAPLTAANPASTKGRRASRRSRPSSRAPASLARAGASPGQLTVATESPLRARCRSPLARAAVHDDDDVDASISGRPQPGRRP